MFDNSDIQWIVDLQNTQRSTGNGIQCVLSLLKDLLTVRYSAPVAHFTSKKMVNISSHHATSITAKKMSMVQLQTNLSREGKQMEKSTAKLFRDRICMSFIALTKYLSDTLGRRAEDGCSNVIETILGTVQAFSCLCHFYDF